MNEGKGWVYEVDADNRFSRMKSVHARLMTGLYNKLRNLKALIQRGFEASAIPEALDPEKYFGEEGPFLHLI